MGTERVARFGTFEFDFASGELRSSGRRVALQGQPAQVLSHLLSHPGRVVTREELRRAIWADDTFVDFDTALNVGINKVRQALGDSAGAPRFIETIPRRGYRFIADVHSIQPSDPAAVASVTPQATIRGTADTRTTTADITAATASTAAAVLSVRGRWIAACLAVAVIVVWGSARYAGSSRAPRSVAVLPFRALAAEVRDEALEVGLAEAVIIRLGQLKQLRVPSINAVRPYARSGQDPVEAGRNLGVEAVLDGSLLRLNGTLRLSVRLLDVKNGTALWADQWDFPWTDIFTVQDSIATEVTRVLALSLSTQEQASLRKHPTTVAAYESYVRARYLLLRRTVSNSRRAAELLETAVGLDPNSAAANAALAFAYISVPLLDGPSTPFIELGRRAARRALERDPTIAEAHAVLGRILVHFDWDAEGSAREIERALQLEPTNPFVLHCTSLMLADQGRFEEALAIAERALALDPASVLANRDKAIILYLAGRHQECIEQCQRTIELDRYYPSVYPYLGRALEHAGRHQEAIEAYLTPFTFSETNREMVAALRGAAEQGGIKAFWSLRLQHLLEEPDVRSSAVADAFMRVGDHDRAMAWLERVYGERGAWMVRLRVDPVWDPLRADPRFQDLLRRAHLAPALPPALPRLPDRR